MSADDPEDEQVTASGHPSRAPGEAATRSERTTRYELGVVLGRGGMGEVCEATDHQLGRQVAIKTIRSSDPSDRAVKRFVREAQIQGRLEHPAIPAVHELGRDLEGRPFFVMKKLSGTTMAKLLRAGPGRPTRQRLLRAFADVCLAVELAHVHDVIHRDLKPDNIVLGEFGEVYVLDWGVAKVLGESDDFDDVSSDDVVTRAGAVLGTFGYMAPEQGRGETDVDHRVDVYSLGVVLGEILDHEADGEVPPELRILRERAMAVRRDDRLPDARSLADGVQRYLDGDRDVSLRRQLAREHMTDARAAFERGDAEDDRRTAMREAGRALAMDPQLAEAGDLISRLMLEPPLHTPPQVERELHDDALVRGRASARGALWGFVAFLGFVPNLVSAGTLGTTLIVAVAIAFVVVLLTTWRARPLSPWWIAIALVPCVVLVARLFSPALVAPGLAALTASALATNPLLGSRRASFALWALMSTSVIGPLAAESLGWLSPTVESVPGAGLLIRAPMIVASVETGSMRGALFVVVLVGAGVMVSYAVRRSDDELRRRLHLQAWQVRQLFPDRA